MAKDYIPGYTGYVPGRKTPRVKARHSRDHQADIPGYAGYVFAVKPENIYGKSFHRSSKEVKVGTHYRNRPHFDIDWNTLYRESFKHPKKTDGSHNEVPTSKKFKIWKNWDIAPDNFMATSCRNRVNKRIDLLKSQGKWKKSLRGSKSLRDMPRATVLPKVLGLKSGNRKLQNFIFAKIDLE